MVFAVVCALCLLPSPCMFLPGEGEELGRIYEQLLLLLEGLCLDPIGQLDRDVIIVDASENFVNFADLGIIQSTYIFQMKGWYLLDVLEVYGGIEVGDVPDA